MLEFRSQNSQNWTVCDGMLSRKETSLPKLKASNENTAFSVDFILSLINLVALDQHDQVVKNLELETKNSGLKMYWKCKKCHPQF